MDLKLFWEELFVASVIMALIITLLTGAGLIPKEIGFWAAVLIALSAVFAYCASAVSTEVIKEYFPTASQKINNLSRHFIPEFPDVAYKE